MNMKSICRNNSNSDAEGARGGQGDGKEREGGNRFGRHLELRILAMALGEPLLLLLVLELHEPHAALTHELEIVRVERGEARDLLVDQRLSLERPLEQLLLLRLH